MFPSDILAQWSFTQNKVWECRFICFQITGPRGQKGCFLGFFVCGALFCLFFLFVFFFSSPKPKALMSFFHRVCCLFAFHILVFFSRTNMLNSTKLRCDTASVLVWSSSKIVSGDLALHPRWLPWLKNWKSSEPLDGMRPNLV